MSLLSLNNVVYEYKSKYNTVRAVNGVSYNFEAGKVYAILGKSGSGKTTLLSVMAGLDIPTNGQVLYKGVPTTELDRTKYRKNDISVIYQSYNLLPLLNSMENIMLPEKIKGKSNDEAKKRAEELFDEMELEEHCKRNYPTMLSGGQQQRVAIARSLSSKPSILFADEPTGNLDVENGNKVIDTLIRLAHEQNYCVIIITHDPSVKEKVDVVLEMKDGKFINDEAANDNVKQAQEETSQEQKEKKRGVLSGIKNMRKRTVAAIVLTLVLIALSSVFGIKALDNYYRSISVFSEEQLIADYEELCYSIVDSWPYYNTAKRKGIDVEKIFDKYEKKLKRKPTDKYFFEIVDKMLVELTDDSSLGKLSTVSYERFNRLKRDNDILSKKAYRILFDKETEKAYSYIRTAMGEIKASDKLLSFDDNVSVEIIKENDIAKIKIKSFDFDGTDEELIKEYREKFLELYSSLSEYYHIIFDLRDVSGQSNYIWMNFIVSLNTMKNYSYTTYNIFNASADNIKFYGNKFISLSEFAYYDNIDTEDKMYVNSYVKNISRITPRYYKKETIGNAKKWVLVDEKTSDSVNNFVDFCKSSGFASALGTKSSGGYYDQTLALFNLTNTKLLVEYSGVFSINENGEDLMYDIEPSIIAESKEDIENLCLDKISEYTEKYGEFLKYKNNVSLNRKTVVLDDEDREDIRKYTPPYRNEDDVFSEEEIYAFANRNAKAIVSKNEAIDDVNAAFKLLKYTYPAYYYFGGDEHHFKVKDDVIKEINAFDGDTIRSSDLEKLLKKHLSFIKDANFYVNNSIISGKGQMYISYDYKVYKQEDKYYVEYDNESFEIISVDGDEELENYIKPTINEEGRISYVLTKMHTYYNTFSIFMDASMEINNSQGSMKLDFKWKTASNDGYLYKSPFRKKVYYGSLPVYTIGSFSDEYYFYMINFMESASKQKEEEKIFILDIRGNKTPRYINRNYIGRWFETYTNDEYSADIQSAKKTTKLDRFLRTGTTDNISYAWDISDQEAKWYRNYSVIIVLVDERVQNVGEDFLRVLKSMENVIVVGSNSYGASFTSNTTTTKYLPNSGIAISYGNDFTLYGDKGYDELDGFLPDLWVEPKDALDAVLNLYKYYDLKGLTEY